MKEKSIAAFALGMTLLVPFARGTELPDGYFEQGYLQSDGTAWIDTVYCPNERTELDAVMMLKDMAGDYYLFGASDRPTRDDRALWMETYAGPGAGNGYVGVYGIGYKGATSGSLGLVTTDWKTCHLTYAGGRFDIVNLTDGKTAVYDHSTDFNKVGAYTNEATFGIFTRHHINGTTAAINPYTRVSRFTISEGGEVKRDLVPACRTEDLVLGLYDVQNGEFYTNAAASGAFSVGIVDAQKPGYHRLAYLESTGTQFIDTGYVFKNHPKVEARVMVTDNQDRDIMGTAKADPGCFIIDYKNGSNISYYRYSSTSSQPISWSAPEKGIGTWKDCSWSDEVWHGDLKMGTVASYDFSANTQTFRIFKGRETGNSPGMLRIAWVKLYDGDELVRDYIPAMVEGKIGLWNKLDGSLAENDGTGDFVVGPLIPAEPGDFTFLEVTGSPAAIGTTDPGYGRFTIRPGDARICRAPTQVEKDGVRATLQGWTLFYDGAYQGEGPEAETEVTAGPGVTTLQWRWTSEFYLTTTNSPNGTVTDATGWKEGGATVELTATPAEGYEFVGWTGDGVTDDNKRDNPLVVTMDAPKTLKANFCSPNARRLAYIGSTSAQQYINTEYVFTNKPAVVARMMMTAVSDTDYLGMPAAKEGCFIVDYNDSNRKLYYRYSTSGYFEASGIDYGTKSGPLLNKWFDCAWSNVVWHGADRIYTVADDVWKGKFAQNKQEFHLFHARSFGQIRYAAVKMYDGDEFVRDFIPAEIGGVTGLWDRRGRKFYPNDNGVAAFEKGEVVPLEDGDFAVSHEITWSAGGTVEVSDPEAGLGETLTLVARPDAGFAFAGWEGDVPADQKALATASFVVTSPLTIRATFAETATYVVDPSGAGDYTSLAAAVKALGESVATLVVRPGAYVADTTVTVRGGITIAADAGAVLCATNDTSVLSLENPLAVVSGLVISNGYTKTKGVGGCVTMAGGLLENCEIVGGRINGVAQGLDAGAPAAGVYMTGGVMRNCRVHACRSVNDYGCAVGVYANGAGTLVENCDIYNCTNTITKPLIASALLVKDGTARGCSVSNNLSYGRSTVTLVGLAQLLGSLVADNLADPYEEGYSGGVYVDQNAHAVIADTTIARNCGFGVGGLWNAGAVALSNVKAYGNSAASRNTYAGFPNVKGVDLSFVDTTDPSETGLVRVSDVYVSHGGSATAPYDAPAKATADPREAVRFCAAGGTVHVSAGDYAVAREIYVDRPLTIRGEGWERTSFYRDPRTTHTRLLNLQGEGAVVEGLAVTNGSLCAGYDVCCAAGVVTNCLLGYSKADAAFFTWTGRIVDSVIREARGPSWWNSKYGSAFYLGTDAAVAEGCIVENSGSDANYYSESLVMLGCGRVSRCTFRNNTFVGISNGALAFTGEGGGIVENCLFHNNRDVTYNGCSVVVANGAKNWTLRNCTITENAAEKGAGLYWPTNGDVKAVSGTVVNTLFYGNDSRKEKDPELQDIYALNGPKAQIAYENCWFSHTGDPRFKRPAKKDFRLRGNSPCRNVGQLWEGAADTRDLLGNPRVRAGAIDIGACQYDGGGLMVIVK